MEGLRRQLSESTHAKNKKNQSKAASCVVKHRKNKM